MTDLPTHLLALEKELQTGAVRGSEARLRELLAPDFREFGRSGKSYSFAETLAGLTAETTAMNTAIDDFSVSILSDTISLVTYRGTRLQDDGTRLLTNRSSVWRLDIDGSWRMVFHQGTNAS